MMSGWLPRMFQHVPRIVGHKWGCIQPGSNVLGFEGCLRLAVECINYSAYVYTSIINYIQIITILTNDLPGIKYGILFSHLQMCFPFKPESYRISHCHVWWPVFFSSLLLVVALWLKILKVQMFTYAHAGAWDWEWMLGARHVLALLSVFVLGVVVGHLLKPEKKYVSWLPWDWQTCDEIWGWGCWDSLAHWHVHCIPLGRQFEVSTLQSSSATVWLTLVSHEAMESYFMIITCSLHPENWGTPNHPPGCGQV